MQPNFLKSYNYNIKITMISSVFLAIGNSLFWSGVYPVFVKTLGGDNKSLGFLSTFGGIILILSLFPSGLLVDKISRSFILKIGLILNALGFFLVTIADSMATMYVAQLFMNIGFGMISPATQTLIADSIKTNQREYIYGKIHFVNEVSNGLGPLLAVGVFLVIGDNWDIETLRQVFQVGFIFVLIGTIINFQMSDKHSLGQESESTDVNNNNTTNKLTWSQYWWYLPSIIIILALITGIGAGLSVQYFGIFFKEIYNLSPTTVNFLFFLSQIFTGVLGLLSPKVASMIGKIETMIVYQLIATALFFVIALIPPVFVVIICFIFRGAFMNSSNPVKNAIVMDLVPKKHRGKMSSLEMFSFSLVFALASGVGGIVLDTYNFTILFMTTTILYFIGTIPLIFVKSPKKPLENNA